MKKLRYHIGARLIVYGVAIFLMSAGFAIFGFDLKRIFFGLDVIKTGLFIIPILMVIAGAAIMWLPKR